MISYATEGALLISAVSTHQKVWVLIRLLKQHHVEARTWILGAFILGRKIGSILIEMILVLFGFA